MNIKKFSDYLVETSLSRILKHNEEHDAGVITAFRKAEDCGKGNPINKEENKKRNDKLLKILKGLGYSVTTVIGTYPEGGKTVKERSFFVVDINDKGDLKENLIKLGVKFEQDSILYLPKGALANKAKACLIGTNKCPNNDIGYKKEFCLDTAKLGQKSDVYNSIVNGRPFIFENIVGVEENEFSSGFDALYLSKFAKEELAGIEV